MKPGSKVTLAEDFDPAFKARPDREEGRRGAPRRRGVELLPSTRRASPRRTPGRAGRAPGARRRGQGRHDPARDERGQPAGRRRSTASRSPRRRSSTTTSSGATRIALPARGRDRHLQPLALRGGARGARPPRVPRAPEAPEGGQEGRRLEASLPRDQRLGALPHRQRLPDREAVPQPVEGGAARAASSAGSTIRDQNWKFSAADVAEREATGTTTSTRSPRCSRTRAPSGRRGT